MCNRFLDICETLPECNKKVYKIERLSVHVCLLHEGLRAEGALEEHLDVTLVDVAEDCLWAHELVAIQ